MSNTITYLNLNEIQIAWMAGILEGEGSFDIDNRSKVRYKESTAPPVGYLKVSMTDEDVIKKFANNAKKTYFSASKKTKGGKTEYICNIGDRKTLMYLLPRLQVHLGKRRKEQNQLCIDALNEWKVWYESGGRTKAASKGGIATSAKKLRLLETNSYSEKS